MTAHDAVLLGQAEQQSPYWVPPPAAVPPVFAFPGGDLLARTPVRPAETRGGAARPLLHSPAASGSSLQLHLPSPSPARLPQVKM